MTRSLTQADFDRFAQISGDDNPIHVDARFSARTRFGRTVSHGMLLYSVLWAMVQDRYQVVGQRAQRLKFPNPAFADESIEFTVDFERGHGGEVKVAMRAVRMADGVVVCEGSSEFEIEGAAA
ncbi:MAG: hydratase [Hyphomicrobiaceae bacterium]|nr:MAG: hydratase [Hyphomicrobiaceae bacterium]